MKPSRSIILISAMLLLTACSNFGKLPDHSQICDVRADIDLREVLPRNAMRLFQPGASTALISNTTISARTLKGVSAERIVRLTSYRTEIQKCGNEPNILSSRHAIGQMVLDHAGVRDVVPMLLSRTCWHSRLRDFSVFPKRDTQRKSPGDFSSPNSLLPYDDNLAEPFCNSIDSELALDTTAYAERAREKARKLEDEIEKTSDRGWRGLLVWMTLPSERFLAYEYVSPFLARMVDLVLQDLIEALPKDRAAKVVSSRVTIVYQTNELLAGRSEKEILIAAPLLRTAFEDAARAVAGPKILAFQNELKRRGPEFPTESAINMAIDLAEDTSTQVLQRFRQNIVFVLAHELAHAYADTYNDFKVDCLAVVNLALLDKRLQLGPNNGIFGMLADDSKSGNVDLWLEASAPEEDLALLKRTTAQRLEALTRYAEIATRKGPRPLREMCDRISS